MALTETIAALPWEIVIMACLTLGLAPFTPPHIVEKLGMLFAGKLVKPIDWTSFSKIISEALLAHLH